MFGRATITLGIGPDSSFDKFLVVNVDNAFFSGLVLQDLTFVHIGNPDRLPDGRINFTKCWQMFTILDHMRRFGKWYVLFRRLYRT